MPSSGETNATGLLLYHHYASYYSQKVVMALHEKRLKFSSYIVHLANFEQYNPQFMTLNPKGQIPVLIDCITVIPDSSRIIDYLEDNFSNGETPKLWPDKSTAEFAQVEHFRNVLDALPIESITYGCLKCPELTKDMKIPSRIRNEVIEANKKKVSVLENYAKEFPELAELYDRKRNRCWQQDAEKQSLEAVQRCLDVVEVILDEVDVRLAQNVGDKSNWWLCSERFSVADISLTVLLHQLDQLGLSHSFWRSEGIRNNLDAYHRRLSERESFRSTFVNIPSGTCPFCPPSLNTIALILATACLIGGIVMCIRK